MATVYPEIKALQALWDNHRIHIGIPENEIPGTPEDFRALDLHVGKERFIIYTDNEYNDIEVGNPLLQLCLILRALEDYDETDDFLVWCRYLGLDASIPELKEYHMGLGNKYTQIKALLGKIDSQLSDFDFELNAGAAQALRKM